MGFGDVGGVGPAVGPTGLRVVDVGVDQTRHQEAAGNVDSAHVVVQLDHTAAPHRLDLPLAHQHHGVGKGGARAAVVDRRADEGERAFLGRDIPRGDG